MRIAASYCHRCQLIELGDVETVSIILWRGWSSDIVRDDG